jgi:hypothetical protein
MALNPFFLQGSSSEQFLMQDLINEQLKIYVIDVYYLPRKILNLDNVLREAETSKFDDSFMIEAYLDNYEGYTPGSDIMSKFGLRLKNEINLIISKERFEDFIGPFISGLNQGLQDETLTGFETLLAKRPSEGDLIFFPLGERLFEIKRVEFEKPFYQLGKNYVFELQCELYEYENEVIDTSIDVVDKTVEDEGYITTLNLSSSVINAEATASIGDGIVSRIILNDDGNAYTSLPTVTISAPTDGITATAVAITTSVGSVNSLESIVITNAGSGYTATNPPTIIISGGGGVGAAATAVVSDSGVRLLTMNEQGSGYYLIPTVTIDGPVGLGETATARTVLNDGKVTLQIVNAGFGYTEAPSVNISTASTVSAAGTFLYNETVTGSLSGTTAVVRSFEILRGAGISTTNPPRTLRVAINNGQFSAGETITGSESSAVYILKSYDNNSYEESYDENEEFEIEADSILDFTEKNPFGEY